MRTINKPTQPLPPRRSEADWNTFLLDKGPNDADGGFGIEGSGGINLSRESTPAAEEELGEFTEPDNGNGNNRTGVAPGLHGDRPGLSDTAAEMCRLLKKRKTLTNESEAELDVYASTRDSEAALALVLSAILEVRDLLKATNKPSAWTVPEDLKDNLRNKANAFILCHNVASYRGKVSNKLVDALRELNIQGMPAEKETAQMKKVIKELGSYLTQARHALKEHIKDSVDDPEMGKTNIADLAAAVVGKTGMKPTVQLYIRLAFLRWQYEVSVNDPNAKESENWWILVDQQLNKWRTEAPTDKALSDLFHGIYKDDIARFGNPAESSESVVEASAIPRWQVVLQAHAKDIAGGKTSAKGKKRKATALEDDG